MLWSYLSQRTRVLPTLMLAFQLAVGWCQLTPTYDDVSLDVAGALYVVPLDMLGAAGSASCQRSRWVSLCAQLSLQVNLSNESFFE